VNLDRTIAVFGASGHTGRFVVSELRRRGLTPILVGRDATKLNVVGDAHPGLAIRVASIDTPASLDHAFSGAAAVINCAGPFLDTASSVIEAALRARIHYLDVTAEQAAASAAFDHFADFARVADIVIAPAVAFYGGLGDLLATAAMGDWATADEIGIAVALDSWKPTLGTRLTGKRNTARRFVLTNGKLEHLADPPPTRIWNFPAPFGTQAVRGLPLAEITTISRHLRTRGIHSYMNLEPIRNIVDPDTPPPTASDNSGRSDQIFLMDVIVRSGSEERRATARGRDIYATTAPIVVEAAERILGGRIKRAGAASAGEIFDARDFLEALSPEHLLFELV
jgi:hypothetical protein